MPEPSGAAAGDHERALVRAARSGDGDAYAELLRPHLPVLRRRIRAAVRHRPDVDPEDVVQETLIRSFEALSCFEERYRFGQYLFGIAKYAILHQVGEGRREVAVAWDEDPGNPTDGGARLPQADELPPVFQALAGANRFPRPDERTRARSRLREMLAAMLAYGGYPHQQIAFAFGIVLWGKPKAERERAGKPGKKVRPDKVPVTGDPARVVAEVSDLALEEAGREFRAEVEDLERLHPEALAEAFRPFEYRLGLTGRELFACDHASRRQFDSLLEERIAASRLRQYYSRDPRKSVADWTEGVKTRTLKYLMGELDLARSPLPMPAARDNPAGPPVDMRAPSPGEAGGTCR